MVDLNAAILGVEPRLRQLIGKNVRLVARLGPGTGHIRVDAGQLDQLMVNLVVNARDAMPDGGTITIATGVIRIDEPGAIEPVVVTPGLYVRLVVWDTGTGMDQETREHIFEPFFTMKAIGKGAGLGLATSYEIVQQAGGYIWVYSEPGIGSSFTLLFPFVDVLKALAPGP